MAPLQSSLEDDFEAEHRVLFDLIARLQDRLRHGRAAEAIPLFEEVLDFARHHFKAEEMLMKHTRYPRAAAHTRAHAQMLARITRLLLELRASHADAPADIAAFLGNWRAAHIDTVDRDFYEHLRHRTH